MSQFWVFIYPVGVIPCISNTVSNLLANCIATHVGSSLRYYDNLMGDGISVFSRGRQRPNPADPFNLVELATYSSNPDGTEEPLWSYDPNHCSASSRCTHTGVKQSVIILRSVIPTGVVWALAHQIVTSMRSL